MGRVAGAFNDKIGVLMVFKAFNPVVGIGFNGVAVFGIFEPGADDETGIGRFLVFPEPVEYVGDNLV